MQVPDRSRDILGGRSRQGMPPLDREEGGREREEGGRESSEG